MTEKDIQILDKFPSNDFIPVVSYLNKEILITKNGDLMMVFKIHGVISNHAQDLLEIRQSLRETLATIYKDKNITFYFTTIRKKQNMIPFGLGKDKFCLEVEDKWNEQNGLKNKFMNELYLSVIVSLDFNDKLYNPIYFFSSLLQITINMIYSKQIQKAQAQLKKIKKNILEGMSKFDMKILSFEEEKDGVLYSEHMRFFSLIANLEKMDFPVSYDEISDVLRQKKINYGIDMVEAVDLEGNKKYASVFTSKAFQDLNVAQIDKIIQAPINLIVTETASLVDNKYVLELIDRQKKLAGWTDDKELYYYSGTDNFVSADTGKETDYTMGQTTLMIIADTKDELVKDIKEMYKKLDSIGLVAIKETVFLPSVFWSQLPGNMRYVKRLYFCPSNKVGNFFSLFSFPIGRLKFNYWGNAISVVPTAIKTSYFLNFHNENRGNAFILGVDDTGLTTILNFLVAQSLVRANPRVFYIDTKRNSEVFISAIAGSKYYKVSPNLPDDEKFKINPFMLGGEKEELSIFLEKLIIELVDWQDDKMVEMGKDLSSLRGQYKALKSVIQNILNTGETSFKASIEAFNNPETNIIYSKLLKYVNDPEYSYIFDEQNTDLSNQVIGISLRTILVKKELYIPTTMCLLYMARNFADGEPSMLVMDDAWTLLNNTTAASLIRSIVKTMPDKNMVTLLAINPLIEKPEDEEYVIKSNFEEFFTTQIFLSNNKIDDYQREVFQITNDEGKILHVMKAEERNMLIKSLNDIVIGTVDLKEFGYLLKVFSCDNIAINAFKKAVELANSKEPDAWLPKFKQIIEDYEKALISKKNKVIEMNQLRWEKLKGKVGKPDAIMGAEAVATDK
ncbi:MAG: VirB4 family type IV secretion/conjugal transfer ATPase [Rickettsiales bacterium]|nr:MAG: VirB4 family type IV secretion/conjugal transfer ATPase [Rickettsiales bacterium]